MSANKKGKHQAGANKKPSQTNKSANPQAQPQSQPHKPAAKQVKVVAEKKKWNSILFQKVFLLAASFLAYVNALKNGFNLDDEFYTNHGTKIVYGGIKAIPKLFTAHTFNDLSSTYGYRPIALLSFLLQHAFLGTGPAMGHLINVLLYAVTIYCVFILLCKWFGKERSWFAFFVALLFALHPLHTEVVASIKNRDELLSVLFSILSLLYAYKWYESKKVIYFVLYPVFFFLALLSKITVVTYIAIIPIAYYFFTDLPIKKIIKYSLPVILPAIMFGLIQRLVLPKAHRILLLQENPMSARHMDFFAKLPTGLYVLIRYLYLAIIPHPLVFYYGYKYVPIVHWGNVWVWVSLIVYSLLLIYVIRTIRNKSILTFGIVFFLVNMVAYSNLLQEGPGLMAERFVYSASLGFCIALCALLYKLFKIDTAAVSFKESKRYMVYIIGGISIVYGIRTVIRNEDWKDKFTLYTHDMPYLHNSAKANMLNSDVMLKKGREYMAKASQIQIVGGDRNFAASQQQMLVDSAHYYFDMAVQNLKQALSIFRGYNKAINNLGIAYFQEDSLLLAKRYLSLAWKADTGNASIMYNLGMLYNNLQMPDSARYLFIKTIKADSSYALAYSDLAKVLLAQKDTAGAIQQLKDETKNVKSFSFPYAQLAGLALIQGDTLQAVAYCEQAAQLPPPNNSVFSFLVKYYASKGEMDKARYYQSKMVQPN